MDNAVQIRRGRPSNGEPPTPSKRVVVRFNADAHDRLAELAADIDLPASELLRRVVDQLLADPMRWKCFREAAQTAERRERARLGRVQREEHEAQAALARLEALANGSSAAKVGSSDYSPRPIKRIREGLLRIGVSKALNEAITVRARQDGADLADYLAAIVESFVHFGLGSTIEHYARARLDYWRKQGDFGEQLPLGHRPYS